MSATKQQLPANLDDKHAFLMDVYGITKESVAPLDAVSATSFAKVGDRCPGIDTTHRRKLEDTSEDLFYYRWVLFVHVCYVLCIKSAV